MRHILTKVVWSQICILIVLACSFVPLPTRWSKSIYGIGAAIIVLYLPGYRISYMLFAADELSVFERFMMSLAISLACMTFFALYLDYFVAPITSMGAIVGAIGLCVGAIVWIQFVQKKSLP